MGHSIPLHSTPLTAHHGIEVVVFTEVFEQRSVASRCGRVLEGAKEKEEEEEQEQDRH